MVDNIVALSRENLDKVGIEHGRFNKFKLHELAIEFGNNIFLLRNVALFSS